jgi:hypothetical protein
MNKSRQSIDVDYWRVSSIVLPLILMRCSYNPGLTPPLVLAHLDPESLPVLVPLSTESDYVKNGSGMLLMQLASGFSVGFARKAFMMSFGQVLLGEYTPCPTPGNRKK